MTFEKKVKSEITYMYRLQTDIFDLFSCLHHVVICLHDVNKNILIFVQKSSLDIKVIVRKHPLDS